MDRILLLMENKENSRLLKEWLSNNYQVMLANPGDTIDSPHLQDESFDLCILDGPCLDHRWEQVQARREAEQPVLLPFLFVTSRRDVKLVTRRLWRAVDEIILMPIAKIELQARVAILLRARRLSLELRISEQQYRQLFEGVGDAVMIYGAQGRFVDCNEVTLQRLGYSHEEFLRLGSADIVHPDFYSLMKDNQKRIWAGETIIVESAHRCKDGKVIPVEVNARGIEYQGKPAILAVVRDITERRQAEDALKESEEKLRMILASSPDAITVADLNGNIIECNQATLDVHGFSAKEELIGRSAFDLIAPKDQQRAMENTKKTLEQGSVKNLEYTLLTKDGREFPAELSASVIRDSSGKVISLVAITKDITYRKTAEEQIKASLKEKEVLLKEVHHRVKNNMQLISSLLTLQAREVDDEKLSEKFNESQNRIRSMALVHDKLYQSENLANINFAEYIRDLAHKLFQTYTARGRITLKPDLEDVLISIDSAIPCGLILNELISNSLKHAFPEGQEGEVKITLSSFDENKIELVVSDNGVGIPENLDFENTKSLGLQLVNMLVKQLDGKIDLNRTGGLEFKVIF